MEPDKQVANQQQSGSSAVAPKPTTVTPPSVAGTVSSGGDETPVTSAQSSSAPSPSASVPSPVTQTPSQPSNAVPPPVATAIGEIAAQPEVDDTALQSAGPALGSAQPQPEQMVPADVTADQPPQPIVDQSAATQSHEDSKTIKLPVQTSLVPALLIGALIVLLFLAVVAYAFMR